MDTQKLIYFIAAVKHLNFTKAANECHIAQTAMSRYISSLERELGFQLFYRDNRNVSLTAAGESFYQEAVLLTEGLERAAAQARLIANGYEGVLRIGFGPSAERELVVSSMEQFVQRYPKVELICLEYNYSLLVDHLAHGFLDVIFSLSCCPGTVEGTIYKEIKRSDIYVMMSKRHPLASKDKLDPQDLNGMDFVIHQESGGPKSPKNFIESCSLLGFRPNSTLVVNTYEAKKLTVQVSRKVALITAGQKKLLDSNFRVFPLTGSSLQAMFYITMLQYNTNPAAKAFYDLLPAPPPRKKASISGT